MNIEEARQLIIRELSSYDEKTYAELAGLINAEFHHGRRGPSGAVYQIEILITWDSMPNGAIRVMGSIDDGSWRAFVPLTESLLKFPEE